ncbi:MAG TPA: zf-HC2 domain-containing protein [Gemmatimonadaceae bacterium]|nr:zf-HC2 domain-containing protein [Gemmatimonadaceae bacterium]
MTCEQFETILPDLLDDQESGASLTHAVRAHLESCADCRALLDDLTSLRHAAATLPALTPSRDLWNGIASRIETPILPLVDGVQARPQRRQISWRAAGIAAAMLVIANAGITYQLLRRGAELAPDTVSASRSADATPDEIPAPVAMRTTVRREPIVAPLPAPIMPSPVRPTFVLAANGPDGPQDVQQPARRREAAKAVYDREINRLRAIVDSGRHKLDPATVAILDRNLRIIDTAIEQCNEALSRDSSSSFLLESLNNAYQTKVKLLRIAAAAASRE